MKKISNIFVFLLLLAALSHGKISFAQSTAIQRAFENVKDQIDQLITTKDENKINELAVKIETFKKVIDLSVNEAQDLKLKLLAADRENIDVWRKKTVSELNLVLKSYAEKKQELENKEEILNIDTLKGLAETFRKWREENYSNVASQVREFLLIIEEEKSVLTAQKRAQKIGEDLRKLEQAKIKGVNDLRKLLAKANNSIGEAAALNKNAERKFLDTYIIKTVDEPLPVNSAANPVFEATSRDMSDNLNSSITTSTAPLTEPEIPPPSIKDLVKSSLEKIKEAYQAFIEMSSLVRKLLK